MTPAWGRAKRLGVFGGAFDPPHLGHVQLVQTAIEQLQLDAAVVVPTGQAWHKERTLTSAEHRLAMTRLAFGDWPQVQVDAREIARPGPSYTVDTLTELRAEHPDCSLYLLMGQDQWHRFGSWHRAREVATLAIICVAARADISWAAAGFDPQSQPPVQLAMHAVGVSSTAIRSDLALHRRIDALVGASVARYIEQHHLYQNS